MNNWTPLFPPIFIASQNDLPSLLPPMKLLSESSGLVTRSSDSNWHRVCKESSVLQSLATTERMAGVGALATAQCSACGSAAQQLYKPPSVTVAESSISGLSNRTLEYASATCRRICMRAEVEWMSSRLTLEPRQHNSQIQAVCLHARQRP